MAIDPRSPSSTPTQTNPWDTASEAGSPTTGSSSEPVTIFGGQDPSRSSNQLSPGLTQQLNRSFGSSTTHLIKLKELDSYQLPPGLSPAQLHTFLRDVSRVMDKNGRVIDGQKLILPTADSRMGRPFTTSSNPLYDGNDADRVLDQTKIAAMIASAAGQLAELDPSGTLAGTTRDRVLQELGEGTDDGTISRVSMDMQKGTQDLQELLGKSLETAEKLSGQEKPEEAAEASATPAGTLVEETKAEVEEDSSGGFSYDDSDSSDGGADGEGSTAETATEPLVEEPQEPLAEKPQEEQVIEPVPTEQTPQDSTSNKPQTLAQEPASPATQSPTAPPPLSQPQTSDPELIALLTEKFSHDYVGGFVAPQDIPPELTAELQTQITALLEQNYTQYELEKLRYSPTLYSKAVERLHSSLKTSSVQTKTQAFLTTLAQSPTVPAEQKQRIQEALQSDTYLQVSSSTNPYHDFVQQATKIVGTQNAGALFVANLASSQSSLEASIIAIGHDRTQKLLEGASPAQLRLLLNIPSNTTLSDAQLEQLRFSIVAVVPTMTARLVYDSQAPALKEGLFKQPKTAGVETARQGGSLRPSVSPDEQEAIDNIKKTGPEAGKAMAQAPRGTKKQLERVQTMLQGSWDSLDRQLQEHIYQENGIAIPPNTHPQDRLPYTTAFIQYTQKDLDAQKRWLELAGVRDLRRQQATQEALKIGQEYIEAQKQLIIAAHLGQKMREEYLEALGLTAAYAAHANALASLQQDGSYGTPETAYLSQEDWGLAQLTPETDFNSYLELIQSSEYLEQNPGVYGQYAGASLGNQGLMGRLRQPFARSARMPSRVQAMKASLAKAAQTAKELKGLALNAAQALAGNPAAIAKLGLDLFRTKTGRRILATGAGLSLLPMLPWLGALLNAANWWNSAASAVGNAVSAVTGGGAGAAGGAGATASAGGASGAGATAGSAAAAGDSGFTGQTIAGQGVAVQTTGFNIFASFSGTMFATTFGFVVFSVFITLIVINGAFLIPTPTSSVADPTKVSAPAQSLYLSLHKKALETKFENDVDSTARYTITITPKSPYSIEIVSITDTYSFFGEGDRTQLETLASPIVKEDFPPGFFTTPAEKQYSTLMRGNDTLVTNTVTLKYNVYDATGNLVKADQTLSNSASVAIGTVKGGCFEFMPAGVTLPGGRRSIDWTESDKLLIFQAFARRAGNNPQFLSLVCSGGAIEVARLGDGPYGGWALSANRIAMYNGGLGNLNNTEYTLIHELGHIISARNPSLTRSFFSILTNSRCMSYPFPSMCNQYEAFAESVVLGIVYKTKYFSAFGGTYNFPVLDPEEYLWIKENIYGGVEF